MKRFYSATHGASQLLCALLAAGSATAFAQVGSPASEPTRIAAGLSEYPSAPLAQSVSPGGRLQRFWLREPWPGSPILVRSFERPAGYFGERVEDPFATDLGSGPLLASGTVESARSTLVYWDATGEVRFQRFGFEGWPESAWAEVLPGVRGPLSNPTLATDENGEFAVLAWSAEGVEGFELYAQVLAPWGAQGAPVRLGGGVSATPVQARLVSTQPGEFLLVWAEDDTHQPGLRRLQLQSFDVWGHTPQPPTLVEEGPAAELGAPDIARSGLGAIRIAYAAYGQVRIRGYDWGLGPVEDVHALPPSLPEASPRSIRISADAEYGFTIAWAGPASLEWPETDVIEAFWTNAFGQPAGAPVRVLEAPGRALRLLDIDSDADGDLHLAWSSQAREGGAQDVWAQVLRGPAIVDLDLQADPHSAPVAAGEDVWLNVRLHNFAPQDPWSSGRNAATGVRLSITGLQGGQLDPGSLPLGFECSQDADRAECVLYRDLPAGSVEPLWLRFTSPASETAWPLQLSVSAHQTDDFEPNNAAAVTIVRPDLIPDAFAFPVHEGVPRGEVQYSAIARLEGFDGVLPLSIAGGEYSLDDGPWTQASVEVSAGRTIRLRHTASSQYSSAVSSTLRLGVVSAEFTSITEAADTTPDAFSFQDVSGARRNRSITSNTLRPVGFSEPATISISGGQYSRNGGAFTSVPGVLNPGDSLRLRTTSSSQSSATVNVIVNVGGVSDTWSVTTGR
ncbi:hypothetical protein SAMN04488509_11019 [Aquimonas voraii]|uniref:Uncharacterized protein n=2 Tax=Aquimonas voraii TaxID=265719 RepID=A0A1G6YI23_9GAMM|nr:hypothetical protein SAMN04488509_11019 [Aquimonas voraii]